MVDESVQVSHRTTWERISDESVQVGDRTTWERISDESVQVGDRNTWERISDESVQVPMYSFPWQLLSSPIWIYLAHL